MYIPSLATCINPALPPPPPAEYEEDEDESGEESGMDWDELEEEAKKGESSHTPALAFICYYQCKSMLPR